MNRQVPVPGKLNGLPESVGRGYLYQGRPGLDALNAQIMERRRAEGRDRVPEPLRNKEKARRERRKRMVPR